MVHRALVPGGCQESEEPLWEMYEEESGEGTWAERARLTQPEGQCRTQGPQEHRRWG